MLMGPAGTGKSTSLKSYIKAGIEPRVIFTDHSNLVAGDEPGIKWCKVKTTSSNWGTLKSNAKMINEMSNEAMQKMTGINSSAYYQPWVDILDACQNFTDHTGKQYGDILSWGPEVVFVVDNLSGLSTASKNLTIGAKPVISQPDWGVMMDNLLRFIETCLTCNCHFLLVAHVDVERNEVTGDDRRMAQTLGRKLAPQLPQKFNDVILAKREGDKFTWSTADSRTDLRTHYLPIKNDLPQDFGQIINGWKAKGGRILNNGGNNGS